MVGQLARIIADGLAQAEFGLPAGAPADGPHGVRAAARAVWDATSRFHDPAYAPEWTDPDIDAAYEAVRALVLTGLTSG
jgi:hypothetical protein